MKEFAIPLLPSNSMNQTLEFYTALGFIITYQQKAPNTYIALKIKDIEIHFFALKQLKSEANFSSCYLVVDEVDKLYETFVSGLKNKFGKVPAKGIPRINPLKDMPSYGVRQFVVVDPSGNYIRIGQPIQKTDSLIFPEEGKKAQQGTPLAKAYELGSRLAEGKDDLKAAAKALDKALEVADETDSINLFRVIVLRTDIANRLEDVEYLKKLVDKGENLLADLDTSALTSEVKLLAELKSTHK